MARKKKREIIEGQPVPPRHEKPGNVYIKNLNVVIQPIRDLVDPVAKVCYTPLLDHYEKRYKRHWDIHAHKVLIIDLVLLFLAAAGLVGGIAAYYLLPQNSHYGTVGTTIGYGDSVVSGAPSVISISWSNDTDGNLACAGLKVELPESVVLDGPIQGGADSDKVCQPTRKDWPGTLLIPLGDLKPNKRGTVIIPVRFYGREDDRLVATSELVYWEDGQALASRAVARIERIITDSVLPLGIEVASNPGRGQSATFYINYENKSAAAIDNAEIHLTLPDDLTFLGSEPAARSGLVWSLPSIQAGSKGSIAVYARLSGTDKPKKGTTVEAEALAPDLNGITRPISGVRENLDPRAANLTLSVEPTRPRDITSIQPGGESEITLRYRNNGSQPIKNLHLWLGGETQKAAKGSSPSELSWNAEADQTLNEIPPGGNGKVVATIHWRDDLYTFTDGVRLLAFAEYEMPGDETRPVIVESNPVDLGIIASLGLRSTAAYYTVGGDQIGLGPLPPVVGETTNYWIFLEATALGGPVQELTAHGTLAKNVHWTGRTSALAGSAPELDALTGEISWRVGSLKPDYPAIVGFEVAFTPETVQAGDTAPLLIDTGIRAVDVRSGIALYANVPDTDTNLERDSQAAGLGTILPKR